MDKANELWELRKDVMDYEDDQTDIKTQLDAHKNYILGNDNLVSEIIEDHNKIAEDFEREVQEATLHLQEKLQEIQKRKLEIHTYTTYVLKNDNLLAELTTDYNKTKDKWKSSITKYTIGLDSFVDSGEQKDV